MKHRLIFEGADLVGKSFLIGEIYKYLEPKYSRSKTILDGCYWFDCDVGLFGTDHGAPVIKSYFEIFKELNDENILVEKFHISDIVDNRLYKAKEVNYKSMEEKLLSLDFKIILVKFPEKIDILEKRIKDRLKIFPHYERILKTPEWYIKQQQEYEREVRKSILPSLTITTDTLPNPKLISDILKWIGET